MADAVAELRSDHSVVGVGVGAAGFAGADRRTVNFAANLAWRQHPLAEELERLTGLPVVVENDANAAGWAEYRFGAATEAAHMLMVTVGTGLGGAIVLDGQLVRGSAGFAGRSRTSRPSRTASGAAAADAAAWSSTPPAPRWCAPRSEGP